VRRHQTPGEKRSPRRIATFHALRSSEGQGPARRFERSREKESPSRGGAGQSSRGWNPSTRSTKYFCLRRPHPARGAAVLHVAHPSLRTRVRVRALEARAGREPEVWKGTLRRGRNPGESRPGRRGNPKYLVRSRGGIKASKQVKLAERSESAEPKPGTAREVRLGASKERSIVVRGTGQPRASVDVGETSGERPGPARNCTPVDNCKEASGLERGARSP
jgi:hypothetical protein